MKSFWTLALALTMAAGLAPAALAQEGTPGAPDMPAASATPTAPAADAQALKNQRIKQMLRVMGVAKLAQGVIDQMMPAMRGMASGIPDKVWKDLTKELKVEFSEDKVLDNFVPIYDKHFSATEIDELIAFYGSPTGQKFVSEQPAMMAEGMAVGEKLGRRAGERLFEKLKAKGYKFK
jgi:hypothetical protein